MKSTQIGGKGTRRIKKKNKKYSSNLIDIYSKKIRTLNEKLITFSKDDMSNFTYLCKELLTTFSKQVTRSDISNRKTIKKADLTVEYWINTFFTKTDTEIIRLNESVCAFISNNFKERMKKECFNVINSISKIITNKDFIIDVNSSKYDPVIFNSALKYFKLSNEFKVNFTDIREQYELKIEQGFKQEADTNFKILRNQYDDYLKSFYK